MTEFRKFYQDEKIKYNIQINGGFTIFENKINLDTKTFKIRKSKKNKIKGLYVKSILNESNEKAQKVFSFIFDKAIKETNYKLGKLYDPMYTRYYCDYYIEKLPNFKNNVIWTPELEFEFTGEDKMNLNYNTYLQGVKKQMINLENYLTSLIKNKKRWYIIPTGVPGHSVAIYLYKINDNKYDMYFCDPNGAIPTDPKRYNIINSLDFHIKSVICILQDICESSNKLFELKGELLRELEPQGGSTLMYIDTNGFCGAFTWLIIFIIMINDGDITPEKLYDFIKNRVEQWRENNDTSIKSQKYIKENLENLKKLDFLKDKKIDLRYIPRYTDNNNNIFLYSEEKLLTSTRRDLKATTINFGNLINIIYPVEHLEKIDLPNMKEEYEFFIKTLVQQLNQSEKIKLRNKNKNNTLNWFENNILSFLLYIKEFYEEHIPEQIYSDLTNTNKNINDNKSKSYTLCE